ncbi:MAG: hypothetical protein M1831_003087 [Alyxoria varia]|nr:MAG: hypothetical protein M1831_003087 [Alyxoria varia]
MYIPTHYVILFAAILLAESGVLFVYTLIGLVKNNPLPWAVGPPQNDAPLCQYDPHGQSVMRGQPVEAPKEQDQHPKSSIEVKTTVSVITSVVYQTMDPASAVVHGRQDDNNLSGMKTLVVPKDSQDPLATSSSTDQTSTTTSTDDESPTAVTTVTAPKATVTVGTTRDQEDSDSDTSQSSQNEPKSSNEDDGSTSKARTTKKAPITSIVTVTSTPPAPPPKPQSTSTSVIWMPAPESTEK